MPLRMGRAAWRMAIVATGFASVAARADDVPREAALRQTPTYQRQRPLSDSTAMTRASIADRPSRRPFDRAHHGKSRPFRASRPATNTVASGNWFQRPYPYHLDYYRMRY